MFEEICNVPFIVRLPQCLSQSSSRTSNAVVSHLDIIPTMLDFAGIECPVSLHGTSIRPLLEEAAESVRETAMISFTRFAVNHDDWGEFYPIRALTDGRYKLAINFFETDEFYDLEKDPHETHNAIECEAYQAERDRLHDALLDEMDRIRDPFRSFRWGARPWRQVREPFYFGGKRRNAPKGFPFQPTGIEAT